MQVAEGYHDAVDGRIREHQPKARLHAHGVWRRTVTVGGHEHATEDYLHIYRTPAKDRFIVHMPAAGDGYHVSYETPESVAAILGEMERRD